MRGTPHWIQPVSVAIEKRNASAKNIESDFDYGVNILRKALLQNDSFEIGNLTDSEQKAARRYITKFSDEGDSIPQYLFDGLRNHSNDWLAREFYINKLSD